LWVLKGDDRAFSSDEQFYKRLIRPYLDAGKPFLIVINQVDKVEPFREWDEKNRRPAGKQAINIEEKHRIVAGIFDRPLEQVITVSANERYHLVELVDAIIHALPDEQKFIVLDKIKHVEEEELEQAKRATAMAEENAKKAQFEAEQARIKAEEEARIAEANTKKAQFEAEQARRKAEQEQFESEATANKAKAEAEEAEARSKTAEKEAEIAKIKAEAEAAIAKAKAETAEADRKRAKAEEEAERERNRRTSTNSETDANKGFWDTAVKVAKSVWSALTSWW